MNSYLWKICLGLSAVALLAGAYRHIFSMGGTTLLPAAIVLGVWAIALKMK